MLTPVEARLIKYMLGVCSNELSCHGCNDLELVKELGLTPEESYELRKAMQIQNGDFEENPPKPDNHYTMDWWVAAYLSTRVGEEFGIPKDQFRAR